MDAAQPMPAKSLLPFLAVSSQISPFVIFSQRQNPSLSHSPQQKRPRPLQKIAAHFAALLLFRSPF